MAIEGVIKAFAAESHTFDSLDDATERRDGGRGLSWEDFLTKKYI